MKRAATKITSVLGMTLVLGLLAPETADARRGGSFGSRGMRTYQAAPPTRTAPTPTAPVQRSMTPPPAKAAPGAPAAANPAVAPRPAAGVQPRRGGFLGGLGGGLLGGLVAGGLIGMLMGNGWGGMGAGLTNTLMQIALIGGVIWLVMALLRRRRQPQPAHAGMAAAGFARRPDDLEPAPRPFAAAGGVQSAGAAAPSYTPQPPPPSEEIGLLQSDRDAFERLLSDVQEAFAREDYAALRERTTPEVMSYLSEELSQNATQGRRNDVSATRLIQADVAEAWREGDTDYATAAMRYESVDVMRDRETGAVLEGDPDRPTETTELWTFVRRPGLDWKLSAIQQA